ncbi:pyridoxal phosphate-dependent decarboxylase family protein [Enterococcus rivorum]|uniref:Glutamate decarboxylase n=1 Tax=Enterococcus rivorum TaxID=762845 RepID=A0A1E5KX78_9ENTE|nr:pyridoxal-dependent decarboxylase [Enterococcus rivorum]MBP2100000.1 glutamate/tyrosine decarboxylase-like PLP-dependent enzyme [Enterococcus rivorum]OEH82474.1 glutamate decarboxylase [Enterococcus rivorum]
MENKSFLELENEFLNANETNYETFLSKLREVLDYDGNQIAPKSPITDFNYEEELSKHILAYEGEESKTVLKDFRTIFDGAIRPHSPYALFNMLPSPLLDTVAANTLTQLYNVNSLMDDFGGRVLLAEQQVSRSLGKLIGWDEATGISCNGGKLTLLYAIKSAIAKQAPRSTKEGVPSNLVVLTNESAHYCVEHVCSILGIGSKQCIRVPAQKDWQMDYDKLKEIVQEQVSKGKKIAAVICCGGTTINFAHDNTDKTHTIVTETLKELGETYLPHFHLDSVIGWLWFNFNSEDDYLSFDVEDSVRYKIEEVIKRQVGMEKFDSFGVDFHKNGLCPYSTSFFITKSKEAFNSLNDGSYSYSDEDYHYGKFRAYRYTIENSRPTMGISSAYVALRRLGISGFQKYLIELQEMSLQFKNAMENYPKLKLINDYSLGWEIVFLIDFQKVIENTTYSESNIAQGFIHYCWNKCNKGELVPLISFVPAYKVHANSAERTAYLLYPINLASKYEIESILNALLDVIAEFEKDLLNGDYIISQKAMEKPIR